MREIERQRDVYTARKKNSLIQQKLSKKIVI